MKASTISIGLGLCIVLIATVAIAKNDGQLILLNEGTYKIVKGFVEVCGQTFTIKNMEPGERTFWNYQITVDCHYHVSLNLESDQTVEKDLGYVTNGFNFRDTIVLRNADVFLLEHKVFK